MDASYATTGFADAKSAATIPVSNGLSTLGAKLSELLDHAARLHAGLDSFAGKLLEGDVPRMATLQEARAVPSGTLPILHSTCDDLNDRLSKIDSVIQRLQSAE